MKRSEAFKAVKEKALQNMEEGRNQYSSPLVKTPEPIDTRKETAKLANTSSHKVREVDTVIKYGTPEQRKRMEEGEKAGVLVKEIKKSKESAPVREGKASIF